MKQGKYETVRYLDIDGVKGVEWTETPPEDKDGSRRHQWIGYRKLSRTKSNANVMLATKGTNFDKHRDDFTAIMYSMKATKLGKNEKPTFRGLILHVRQMRFLKARVAAAYQKFVEICYFPFVDRKI